MRRILIDNARRKKAVRHGGALAPLDIDELDLAAAPENEQILALNEALERFHAVDPAGAALVKLRFFAGLTLPDAARAVGVSLASAKRDWAYARAWLFREIQREDKASPNRKPPQ
jgi:RNA polymerase sigma factor (TIGR02999 family)